MSVKNLMTLEEAREFSGKSWAKSKCKGYVSRRKCFNCFGKWKKEGSIESEKPPVFPLDHESDFCPLCGEELCKGSIPF